MWLLHQWHDHAGRRVFEACTEAHRSTSARGAGRQSLPLRHASAHRSRRDARGAVGALMAAVFSRRTALQLSGALIIRFAIPLERGVAATQPAKKAVDLGSVESFLAINPDGTVTVFSGKVDLGTGLRTALTQIVADELDVGFSKVVLIQGDTDLTPDQGVTFGSLSIQNGGAVAPGGDDRAVRPA